MNWLDFKNIASSRGLSIQYTQTDSSYELSLFDGGILRTCKLDILETPSSDQLDFETNFKPNGNKPIITQSSPFAAKTLSNGKKLYKREHGIQATLTTGSNTVLFTVPYAWVKIIGLEIFGGEHLDYCDLIVLDSTTGTYSTIPNYQLNQFGYSVNIAAGEYEEENAYDADLYQDMQIKIVYNSQSAKTICIIINCVLEHYL
jgi:hypothetical protein